MRVKYRDYNFNGKTLAVIDGANTIIEEYESLGYTLTLRQLYYRFVAAGAIDWVYRAIWGSELGARRASA